MYSIQAPIVCVFAVNSLTVTVFSGENSLNNNSSRRGLSINQRSPGGVFEKTHCC